MIVIIPPFPIRMVMYNTRKIVKNVISNFGWSLKPTRMDSVAVLQFSISKIKTHTTNMPCLQFLRGIIKIYGLSL